MNRNDTIQQLRSLNPIPSDPSVPPVETLIAKLDLSVRSLDDIFTINPPRRAQRSILPRVAVGAAVATAAVVVVVTLSGGPGGHGVSVAAAFEQAITPHGGVLHIVTDTENIINGQVTTTVHGELWTAQNPRRQRSLNTLRSGGETSESEGAIISLTPPRTQSWLASDPSTIHESVQPIDNEEQTPTAYLRKAYQEGRLTVIGKEELDGRAVWRLNVIPAATQTPQTLNGAAVPDPTVTVDASTFVPLENVIYSVSSASGKPALETTRVHYDSYEELPASSTNLALLNLAPHPGAKVVTEPSTPSEH
jgi:hypothetical protein